jgi:hypothetical protein
MATELMIVLALARHAARVVRCAYSLKHAGLASKVGISPDQDANKLVHYQVTILGGKV